MRIEIGDAKTFTRRFTQSDFDRFARLTRDNNPIHVDPDFSARTRFGQTVAHGMMLYSTICRVLGSGLPGPGTLQVCQEMIFRHPTYTDTDITTVIEVKGIDREKGLAQLKTTIHLPDGNLACEGSARVQLPGWRGGFPGPEKTMATAPGATSLKHLKIGQRASTCRTFTREDLTEYADLTGDRNPLFNDSGAAKSAGFERCLLPGPLLSGMFSDLLGTRLPGRGTNWLKQNIHLSSPAYVGEEITAEVQIVRLRPEKNLVNLRDTCKTSSGRVVCQAHSLVLVKDIEE